MWHVMQRLTQMLRDKRHFKFSLFIMVSLPFVLALQVVVLLLGRISFFENSMDFAVRPLI